ncbi:hypothetical protein [Saccharopolyspora sp. ASAGF58]|nr:hypothetical protein [Saccharopolyspora sp. ASAGF58]
MLLLFAEIPFAKAVGHDEIACTHWARPDWNAGTKSTAAATALIGET